MRLSYNCICCEKEIKVLDMNCLPDENNLSGGMWNDGMIAEISAGYGSRLDGDKYVIAICDVCANEEAEKGNLIFTGNYMFEDMKERTKLKKP